MPLPNVADRRQYHFDKLLMLRDPAATALSATASETGVAFDATMIDVEKVVVAHKAITGTISGANNWTVTVEVSDAIGGTYVQVGTSGQLKAPAIEVEIPISGVANKQAVANASHIRVTATKAGTIGDLSYGAYITPAKHAN